MQEAPVASGHSELFHYTSIEALHGIMATGTLWASNALQLNDSKEMIAFWECLHDPMKAQFTNILKKEKTNSVRFDSVIEQEGEIDFLAKKKAEKWINAAYSGLIKTPNGTGMFYPFVTSFTTHSKDDSIDRYRREHGMLSQWRSYANEGICIVFDTNKLVTMILSDNDCYTDNFGTFADVIYTNDTRKISTLLQYLSGIAWYAAAQDEGGFSEYWMEAADETACSALRVKHMGFIEENECRIVTLVPTNNYSGNKSRLIHTNNGRAFIKLFESSNKPLPIKKIIVGPSRSQQEIADRVRWIMRNDELVHCSDTPYIPPK